MPKKNIYKVVDFSRHEYQNDWEFTDKNNAMLFASQLFNERKNYLFHIIIKVEMIDDGNVEILKTWTNWDDSKCWKNC